MVTRVLTAILISPPMGIGSGVITELCEPEKRAQKLGWWTLMLTLGTPGGPFVMGFVTKHVGFQWIYWIFAMINFAQFIAYLLLGEETLYVPADGNIHVASMARPRFFQKLVPRRINPRQLKPREFVEPLFYARLPRVLIPACAHAIVFCYGNIALIVEMPIAFGEKFDFDSQQIGLQFIAIIIGCLLGEQLSGPMSDWFLQVMHRKRGYHCAADRLWLSYIGFGTVIAGLLVWGFQLEKATSWNVTPCVGAAISSFGNQIITTILISFAVDSHKEASTNVGVCINFFRHIYGFVSQVQITQNLVANSPRLGHSTSLRCSMHWVWPVQPVSCARSLESVHYLQSWRFSSWLREQIRREKMSHSEGATCHPRDNIGLSEM